MMSTRWPRRGLTALALASAVLCFAIPGSAHAAGASLWVAWTATGDDGLAGRAQRYDLRYSTMPPGGSVQTWWSQATRVPGVPTPSRSGVVDSVLVTGLSPATTYYFVLRIADEALNWSSYSNVASAQTAGTPAPAPVLPPQIQGDESADLNAYPNPASGGPIRFELRVGGTEPRPVHIRVFDLNGHVVAEVADTTYPSGTNSISWNRLATSGTYVAPGYYEVMGTVGSTRVSVRLLLLP